MGERDRATGSFRFSRVSGRASWANENGEASVRELPRCAVAGSFSIRVSRRSDALHGVGATA